MLAEYKRQFQTGIAASSSKTGRMATAFVLFGVIILWTWWIWCKIQNKNKQKISHPTIWKLHTGTYTYTSGMTVCTHSSAKCSYISPFKISFRHVSEIAYHLNINWGGKSDIAWGKTNSPDCVRKSDTLHRVWLTAYCINIMFCG